MKTCLEKIAAEGDGCGVTLPDALRDRIQDTLEVFCVRGSAAFVSSRNIVVAGMLGSEAVALKMKLPAGSALPSEVDVLTKVRCESVPPIIKRWRTEGADAFAMPWYPLCLFDVVAEDRISRVLAWRVVAAVSRALLHAHAAGVTHCDLKPENVFMEDSSGRGCVLGDWDLACDGKQSEMGDLRTGTLEYNPPPSLGLSDVSFAADAFRLGALMFVMLFGVAPVWTATGTLHNLDLVTEDNLVYVNAPMERNFSCRKFEMIMLRVLLQANLPNILLIDVYAEALENIFKY